MYYSGMKESEVERHFVWAVERTGGKTWKFTSPGRKGVADRIACLPDGQTWFVELKTKGGRLSPLQKMFASDMAGVTISRSKRSSDVSLFLNLIIFSSSQKQINH
jgi:hypothetical protein